MVLNMEFDKSLVKHISYLFIGSLESGINLRANAFDFMNPLKYISNRSHLILGGKGLNYKYKK